MIEMAFNRTKNEHECGRARKPGRGHFLLSEQAYEIGLKTGSTEMLVKYHDQRSVGERTVGLS
jgi:hypothetical protein